MANPFASLGSDSEASDNEDETVLRGSTKAVKKPPASLPKTKEEIVKREAKEQRVQKEKKDAKVEDAKKKIAAGKPVDASVNVKPSSSAREKKSTRPQKHDGQDRKSGTGRGKEVAKGGAGGNNWGSKDQPQEVAADESAAVEIAEKEGGEEADAAVVEEQVQQEEEPQGMTLEEYEALKASKRNGAAFAELKLRTVSSNKVEGKEYKKSDQPDSKVLIKIGGEETQTEKTERIKKEARAGLERLELGNVTLKRAPTPSASSAPRGGGDRREQRSSGPRPARGSGAPRGSARGGASSSRPTGAGRAVINPQDEAAFPKLGA